VLLYFLLQRRVSKLGIVDVDEKAKMKLRIKSESESENNGGLKA
jgi:hypothetical protein